MENQIQMGTKHMSEIPTEFNTSGELFYPAIHIPEIQEYIFQFCDEEDLKVCRLVSKAWNLSSKKSWRANVTVKLASVETFRMEKFLEFKVVAERQGIFHHYDKFTLSFAVTEYNLTIFNSFWSQCGPYIKILKLNGGIYHDPGSMLRSILFQYCPNLESLHVKRVMLNDTTKPRQGSQWTEPQFGENKNLRHLAIDPDDKNYSDISWVELLSHFPNLENFRLLPVCRTRLPSSREVDQIFRAVTIIRKYGPAKLKLQNIFALHKCNDDIYQNTPFLFKLLVDASLRLKEVGVKLNGKLGANRLNQILSIHEVTVEKLELDRKICTHLNPEQCFCAPVLGNLTELKLHSRVFTTMTFLKFTPNLTTLAINDSSDNWYPNNIVSKHQL